MKTRENVTGCDSDKEIYLSLKGDIFDIGGH